MNAVGGYKQIFSMNTCIYAINDYKQFFLKWLDHLLANEWGGQIPDQIDLVLTGDGDRHFLNKILLFILGGKYTKFGFYLPNVSKPQSPKNIALATVWTGAEKLTTINDATSELFSFAELLNKNGIIWLEKSIPVRCFFVGDLKMESTIFGVQGGNANSFCTHCHVTRAEHIAKRQNCRERNIEEMIEVGKIVETLSDDKIYKQQKIRDIYSSVSHVPLLKIPIEQNVPPPMHIIQGTLNAILKTIHKQDQDK